MTSTMYREINALQEPFDGGIDQQGRAMVIFNIFAIKARSNTFLKEIAGLLVAAGVGEVGEDLIASNRAAVPPTGTITVVTETSGTAPERVQNQKLPKYPRPTAKITVYSPKYDDAMSKALTAYSALCVVRNQAVTVA